MSDEYEKYDAFAKQMEERFPKMFANPYGGFCVGEGWWPILESLCANIQSHTDWWNKNRETRPVVEQVVVEQIKEKFGGLRFYYQGGDEKIQGMVRMAEAWAGRHCETCGAPGKSRDGGWIKTLCDHHEAERQAKYKERVNDEDLQLSILEAMKGESQ
jgi:hypothetical protein